MAVNILRIGAHNKRLKYRAFGRLNSQQVARLCGGS